MKDFVFRKAVAEDLNVLLEFEQGIILEERPYDNTLSPDPISYYNLESLLNNPDALVVVAADDTKIIGSGYAIIKEAKPYVDHNFYAYLGFMYTSLTYRGKGVNGKILEALKEWTKSKGIQEMRLTVYPENLSAIKAYKKMGFENHLLEMRIDRTQL